jgi:excisionase family DNA binding protein
MPIPPPRSSHAMRFLSPTTLANRLEVSIKTVRRWIAKGDLPVDQFGHLQRISEDDLNAFAATRRRRGCDR